MNRLDEDVVLDLIGRLGGNITAIARACSVQRSSMIAFIEKRPDLLQALHDARAALADDVRSNLVRYAIDGKPWAVKLALQSAAPEALEQKGEDHERTFTNAERKALILELFGIGEAEETGSNPEGPPAEGQ